MTDVTINTPYTLSTTILFSLLSTKLRTVQKFYNFYVEDTIIYPVGSYELDLDDSRLTDKYRKWRTFLTNCKLYWGQVVYFEITLEKHNTSRFFMIGLESKESCPYNSCVTRRRFYPNDHEYPIREKIVSGARIGVLYDTANTTASLFVNGGFEQKLCTLFSWDNKSTPYYVVISIACGDTTVKINQNVEVPAFTSV